VVYENSEGDVFARPYDMFFGNVEIPRFRKIEEDTLSDAETFRIEKIDRGRINKDMDDDGFTWIIRDQEGNFAHKGSIKKVGKLKYRYRCHKTFSESCRGYVSKVSVEKALSELNAQNTISGFDIIFHIEQFGNFGAGLGKYKICSKEHEELPQSSELTQQSREFKGENCIEIFKILGEN